MTLVMSAKKQAWRPLALIGASVLALAGFLWPLVGMALPQDAQNALPVIVIAIVPALIVTTSLMLDRSISHSKTLALLGVLAAIGTAVRIASTGVGGFEAVFIVFILAGRAYGARFGFLLGMLTIAVSSVLWGGFGPWTAFQMFAAGWVGAGAGLLPGGKLIPRTKKDVTREIGMLMFYGIIASYAFGLVMNMWFWPFAVGPQTDLSYDPGAGLMTNLQHFGVYTLLTSTLTWDTIRAVTSAVGIAVVGKPVLAALRRAKV